jgi:hypothetical protein
MNVRPKGLTVEANHMFDEIVCLKLEAGWMYIESGEQALACLIDYFADHTEPSWQRAHSTCMAFLAGQAAAEAATAAFIVAAMAAGIGFEVATNFDVIERHVEEAATEGLMRILFNDDETDQRQAGDLPR